MSASATLCNDENGWKPFEKVVQGETVGLFCVLLGKLVQYFVALDQMFESRAFEL